MESPSNDDVRSGRSPGPHPTDPGARAEARARREHRDAAIMSEYGYRILSALAVLLLATGTVVYHFLEDWSWVDSLYFSAVAVSTVGFGDLVPTRDASKLFTILYILSGISIITTFLNMRLKHHTSSIADRVRSRMPESQGTGGGVDDGGDGPGATTS